MIFKWDGWGKPKDESESREFENYTFERLRKYAREHYPILKKIKDREYEVEKLAKNYIAKEADVSEDEHPFLRPSTLESLHKEICEEQGDHTERAKMFHAAMEWSKKRNEIDEIKQKAQKVTHSFGYSRIDPRDYREAYEARTSLERTIRDVMTKYYNDSDIMTEYNHNWDKEYEFRENLEIFLSNITIERCCIRRNFRSSSLFEIINIYLANPSWHSRGISDSLLVDLIDTHLISLERDSLISVFRTRVADQIEGFSPFDSRIAKLLTKVIKKTSKYSNSRLAKAARKIVVIRDEIGSGTYHAKTLIERLKEVEEQGIVIHSLIYALLELRYEQEAYREV